MAISKPDITINIIPAQQVISNQPQRVLMVGQKISAGSATSGALVTEIDNSGQENALFGEKSMLAAMVRSFKRINKVSRLDAIPLSDNGSAVKATGTFAFTGPSTAAGTLYISIGSSVNNKYTLDITSGMTATQIGDAFAALITADTKACVTAANSTGTVTVTAVNGGTEGNSIGLRSEGSVAGVGLTITAMASGATNPTLTNLFDVISNQRYQTIVYPASYDLSALTSLLQARFNVTNKVIDGVGIICQTDTFANLKTLGNTYNLPTLAIIGIKKIADTLYKGAAIFELNTVIAAQVAAIRALRLTEDANLSQYVISNYGSRDSFGGTALASLPYFNTPFYDLPVANPVNQFTDGEGGEEEELNEHGISILGNNIANNRVILGEMVTTYKTDAGGNPDDTFKYLNTVDTASNVREYFFNTCRARFAQSRLTEGDLVPNRNMANAGVIEAFLMSKYTDLSGEDYVLTQAGEAARDYFTRNCRITLDLEAGKATIAMKTPIVTQLRKIIAAMQIAFSTQG